MGQRSSIPTEDDFAKFYERKAFIEQEIRARRKNEVSHTFEQKLAALVENTIPKKIADSRLFKPHNVIIKINNNQKKTQSFLRVSDSGLIIEGRFFAKNLFKFQLNMQIVFDVYNNSLKISFSTFTIHLRGTKGIDSFLQLLCELFICVPMTTDFLSNASVSTYDMIEAYENVCANLNIITSPEVVHRLEHIRNGNLDLSQCFNGLSHVKAISSAIEWATSITKLDLSNNNICDEGMKYIFECLNQNRQIEVLLLNENQRITYKGAKYLEKLFHNNHPLKTLGLSKTGIGDKGAISLLTCILMTKNKTLVVLDLSCTSLTNQVSTIVQKLLLHNNTLQELILSNNDLSTNISKKTLQMGIMKSKNQKKSKTTTTDNKVTENTPVDFDEILKKSKIDKEEVQITERIGKGTFGVVFKGLWKEQLVAIKWLGVRQDEETVQKIYSEISILKDLNHPNIVKFYGVYEDKGQTYIVMEFVKQSLKSFIAKASTLSWKARLKIAKGIANGMDALHRFNPPILHLDLNSRNILITEDLTAKVCDFGLSKKKPSDTFRASCKKGTVDWMAPEMILNNSCTQSCDIYSFGIVMWELLNLSSNVFPKDQYTSDLVLMNDILYKHKRPRVKVGIKKDFILKYEELMQRCWTPHRAQRPKSFQVIIKRLEEIEKSLIYDGDSELVTSVKLPVRTPLGTWMMKSTIEFFSAARVLYTSVQRRCVIPRCLTLCSGKFEELNDEVQSKVEQQTVKECITNLLDKIDGILREGSLFPKERKRDLDEYSRGTLESIFKQIYAIFIHIYTMHINDIMMQQLDYQFNYSFKRFLLFSIEFKLLSAKYLEPFKPQLKEIFGIEKLT